MAQVQYNSKVNDVDTEESIDQSCPIPLMSIVIRPTEYPCTSSSSYQTPINEMICSYRTTNVSTSDDNILLTSNFTNQIDISKFHFAHVIKVPHGTNLLASDNQSTTVCINSIENIIHLITPTGYHIRSSRWPETEDKITDLLWCEVLQIYLVATSRKLYTLKYDSNHSVLVEKSLDFSHDYSSLKIFIVCNSYRLYTHDQSTKLVDVYNLQFVHLQRKQLPDCIVRNQVEGLSCSDSFLVLYYKQVPNKFIVLDPIKMMIVYEFDLSYKTISSLRCFNNENTLLFIGTRQDDEKRLVFLNFRNQNKENKIQPVIVEKPIEKDEQSAYLLPNSRDIMIFNASAFRVQYLKYRC
ncbi:unnamed protein product [Rotaria magnacalcarata]|uniref:Uncharacterized protein n=1 Tax=Rotaria magnacalcarata TaxID=392030 RepID=A0A816MDS2_9BILA|nr:unnamed protein product [Rotaria magnacalcarata]CAF3943584.1 unnamed protein product [Rotaria magnacalcarata]